MNDDEVIHAPQVAAWTQQNLPYPSRYPLLVPSLPFADRASRRGIRPARRNRRGGTHLHSRTSLLGQRLTVIVRHFCRVLFRW